jgi:glutaredoxin
MKRFALLLFGLLLACSPPSDDDAAPPAAPAQHTPPAAPRSPKPAQEHTAPRRGKSTLQASGSYYQYVDESGHVRFAASLDAVPETQRSTAGHPSEAAPAATRRAAALRADEAADTEPAKAEVVLYTTASCPYCKRAIAYLDQIGQDYVNKNVEHDDEARGEYLKLTSGRPGVPVIVVGKQWMQGWSQDRLDQMLADAH